MGSGGEDGLDLNSRPVWTSVALTVLPAFYLVSALVLSADAGPLWLWHASQPTYTYLLDAINLLHHHAPGQISRPGTPVQAITALVLWFAHGFADADTVTDAVLADPEGNLRAVALVLYALTALAMLAVGVAARLASGKLITSLLAQAGPLLSLAAIHHTLGVTPEAVAVPALLILGAVTFLALRPGGIENRPFLFAAAFGAVAGFGLAVDFAFLPASALPLFLLRGRWSLAVYGGVVLASFVIFTYPAAGDYDLMASAVATALASAATDTDWRDHLQAISLVAGRLPVFIPILATLVALGLAWSRHRSGAPVAGMALRALGGVLAVQVLFVVVAALRPGPAEMILGLALTGLALALVHVGVASLVQVSERAQLRGREVMVILFGLFLLAQMAGMVAEDLKLRDLRVDAARVDNAVFERCLRVYFPSASDQAYALFTANRATGGNFADLLAARAPRNDIWIDTAAGVARDWFGRTDLLEHLAAYPCAMFRGSDRRAAVAVLDSILPGLILRDECSVRYETILTSGVDCTGALTGQ